MAITQPQFDALIQRLEKFAHQQPALYKLCVALLAMLGYAYIFTILALLLAILGLLVAMVISTGRLNGYMIKFAILILVPTFIVLKSLWVHFPPPTGLELRQQDVPRLFELVDELTLKLEAPRFHHILLTEEFSAGVTQRPRLGIFGWQQNYLRVGLPLMQALSPEQLRAVLAHELGHLSGNHSRFAGWIYRVRQIYVQILERLQQSNHGGSSVLFQNFFNWYAPFFYAYSFVLARMDEYEADRCAAALAGAQNVAEALINTTISARFLHNSFWPNIDKQVIHQVEPPATIYTDLVKALAAGIPADEATIWLDRALAQKTDLDDTHPCLTDRLSALGYLKGKPKQLPLPADIKISAAQEFLESKFKQFLADFDHTWKQEMETPWRQRYAYAKEAQNQLKILEKKAKTQQLTPEDAWDHAAWTAEFKGNEAAIPLLREILTTAPAHPSTHFLLGQILLEKNELSGIGHIEKAMEKDPEKVLPGCELIYAFFKEQGQIEKAKAYQARAQQHYELLLIAQQERSFVQESDTFLPHDLPSPALEPLRQLVSRYTQVKEVYLVRKRVIYFPEKPFYVLGIKLRRTWYKFQSSDSDQQFFNQFVSEVKLPGQAYVILLNSQEKNFKNLEQILREIQGAAIYKHEG
ncbi:M48 family metallopeptidase [Microcoleus sp. FACHB-672]|uniref:M48 family metallopeptidase n=1 Tax=Microcoleus sp. FACHB-672 TaxID=2692825 RepID=UPI0016874FD4|nr:M48 family metallopeptidase [Microcoleus sp. FACHB-672]MBD2042757.1 M48 family metalloprotease [Microcoleus sp. FACHB-672]